jgi:hypothetical protein
MDPERAKWHPLHPRELHRLLAGFKAPWWIAGGWAIDLFLGEQTRDHLDTDLVVLRRDQLLVQAYLVDWELQVAAESSLRPWRPLEFLELGANSIWCRPHGRDAWSIEVMFMETDGEQWVYRRAPAVRGPISSLGRCTAEGLPYLAPEVQLLFKAKFADLEKNQADFSRVLPLLGREQRTWLAAALSQEFAHGHDWVSRVAAGDRATKPAPPRHPPGTGRAG